MMKKEEFLRSRERIKISKLMSYILRHAPWEFGVEVDEEGFASIEEVVRAVKKSYPWVKKEHILWIVENDPKGRFEIRGDKIRA
ncbi:MAG: putative 2-phosphotransferase, partial [Thermococcaceae archaeon]|nr:putative 2-phosphotransferase [Thermococcaceae archaeon]